MVTNLKDVPTEAESWYELCWSKLVSHRRCLSHKQALSFRQRRWNS